VAPVAVFADGFFLPGAGDEEAPPGGAGTITEGGPLDCWARAGAVANVAIARLEAAKQDQRAAERTDGYVVIVTSCQTRTQLVLVGGAMLH
jgi:hypothetical protein